MPNYKRKRMKPATPKEFERMTSKYFTSRDTAFITVLYYWGIRVSEAINLKHTDLYCDEDFVYLKVKRLKKSKQTDDIPIFINSPGMSYLLIEHAKAEQENRLIFPFSRWTGWRICKQVGVYPHFFRLSRFTQIADKYGLVYLMNFGGITADTANAYVGKVELRKKAKGIT